MRKPTLWIFGIILGCALQAGAQQPNSWRGLTLDESSIEDAVTALGEPMKRKENVKLRTKISQWLGKKMKFTRLVFKVEGNIDKALLYFRDGNLRVIEIDPKKKINPNSLSDAYGIDFLPKVADIEIGFLPDQYERNQGKIYPKNYPTVYHLIGVSESSFVVARVGNLSFGGAIKKSARIPHEAGSFPGKVELVQIVSKELQDTAGFEALK